MPPDIILPTIKMVPPRHGNTSWLLISKPYASVTTLIEGKRVIREHQPAVSGGAVTTKGSSFVEHSIGALKIMKPYVSKQNLVAISDDMPPTVASNPQPDFFDFFGLAAELRDLIYDQALVVKTMKLELDAPAVEVVNGPATNLLLVSTQFNREYSSRAAVHKSLAISDHDKFNNFENHDSIDLPPIAIGVSSISVNLATMPGTPVTDELQGHRVWLPGLLAQVNTLEKLSIRMFFAMNDDENGADLAAECKDIEAELDGPEWDGEQVKQKLSSYTMIALGYSGLITSIGQLMRLGSLERSAKWSYAPKWIRS